MCSSTFFIFRKDGFVKSNYVYSASLDFDNLYSWVHM
jgi:hypothetical protein